MLIVAQVHNSALSQVVEVENYEQGIDEVKDMSRGVLLRGLSKDEREGLTKSGIVYVELDYDNHYSWTIGVCKMLLRK